jgi:diadenosine tetraphosphate (Ap4A) HIT family hydrolase
VGPGDLGSLEQRANAIVKRWTRCKAIERGFRMKCISCEQHLRMEELPLRDRIHLSTHWRLAHAWSSLAGWLVVISRRHVVELADLTSEEAAELGQILRRASAALRATTGCAKTYIVLFGEQPGFEHLHVHIVPRMADFDQQHLGAGVFEFLKRPEREWVSADSRDRLAAVLVGAFAGPPPRAATGAQTPTGPRSRSDFGERQPRHAPRIADR